MTGIRSLYYGLFSIFAEVSREGIARGCGGSVGRDYQGNLQRAGY